MISPELREDLFSQDAIQFFIQETTRLLREAASNQNATQARLRQELAAAEDAIEKLISEILAGLTSPAVRAAIEKAEAENARLMQLLKAEPGGKAAVPLPKAGERFQTLLDELPGALGRGDVGVPAPICGRSWAI